MTDRTVGGANEAAERRAVQQRIAVEVLGRGGSYGDAHHGIPRSKLLRIGARAPSWWRRSRGAPVLSGRQANIKLPRNCPTGPAGELLETASRRIARTMAGPDGTRHCLWPFVTGDL